MYNLDDFIDYPCVMSALETKGLAKLFQDYPEDAIAILTFGCRASLLQKHPETLEEAFMAGHYLGTLSGGFKNVQQNRLAAQKVYSIVGNRKLASINENDLWLWYIQTKERIPIYHPRREQVCNVTRAQKIAFERFQALDMRAIGNLRKMISKHHPCLPIAFTYKLNWRVYLDEEYWDDKDHPLNQLLTKNLDKSLFSLYLQGYERNGHLNDAQKERALENYHRGLARQETSRQSKRERKTQRRLANQKMVMSEVVQSHECCINAIKIKGLQSLQTSYPQYWCQILGYRRQVTRLISATLTVKRAICLGYYPKTIPSSSNAPGSSFSSIKRHRKQAAKWLTHPLAKKLVKHVTEEDLWLIHAQISQTREDRFNHKELQSLRSMVFEVQKRLNQPIVLSMFNWDWQKIMQRPQAMLHISLQTYLFVHQRDVRLKNHVKFLSSQYRFRS